MYYKICPQVFVFFFFLIFIFRLSSQFSIYFITLVLYRMSENCRYSDLEICQREYSFNERFKVKIVQQWFRVGEHNSG